VGKVGGTASDQGDEKGMIMNAVTLLSAKSALIGRMSDSHILFEIKQATDQPHITESHVSEEKTIVPK